jgi:hypothetical protein
VTAAVAAGPRADAAPPRVRSRAVTAIVAELEVSGFAASGTAGSRSSRCARGGARKPEQAWRRFATLPAEQMPEPLARAARLVMALARAPAANP